MRDRDRSTAEVKPVYQNARDRTMYDADPVGPLRSRDPGDDRHQADHQRHADGEIGQRIGIMYDIFGGDESGTPEHDKNRRRRARGKIL